MAARSGQEIADSRNRRLRLGKLIQSGGAGSVFHVLGSQGEVAKLYHDKIDKPLYQRKIAAMLELAPKLPPADDSRILQMAWPLAEVFDLEQRFLGFIMPELDVSASIELEYILQDRQARAHGLPTGLGAKITLAANLCALIQALHQQHHYVVDMKPLNLRFYKKSLYMAMLDCDGFSIQGRGERFPAGQFTVEYLAPEFQASGHIPPGEEENQDRFALAVIIFQLLNFGIHPYSGRPLSDKVPTDLPGRIRQQYYPYGRRPHAAMQPALVSGHELLGDDIRDLFDRAFTGKQNRPTAEEWRRCLSAYALRSQGKLVVCARNKEHQHFAGKQCPACAREEITRNARKNVGRQQAEREQSRARMRTVPPPAPRQPRPTAYRQPAPLRPAPGTTPYRQPAPPPQPTGPVPYRQPPPAAPAHMPSLPFTWSDWWTKQRGRWQSLTGANLSVIQRILLALLAPVLLALSMWGLRGLYLSSLTDSFTTRLTYLWHADYELQFWLGLLGVTIIPLVVLLTIGLAVASVKLLLRRP